MVPIADRVGNELWREQNPIFMRKLYPHVAATNGLTQIRNTGAKQ